MPAAIISNVFFILTILSQNDTLDFMKIKSLSLPIKIVYLIFVILLLVTLSAALASLFLSSPTPPPVAASPTPEIAQIDFVEGGQMSGANLSLNTNLNAPPAMLLPLKTLADFPASSSAHTAIITTTKGELTLSLFPELAPLTVANFASLSQAHFYDHLKFHRLEPGFVLQIGDPASRDVTDPQQLLTLGTGYPGYRIADEFDSQLSHDQAGIVSMANINADGQYPHTGGSQFFITLAPATYLDGRHAVFGRISQGLDVLAQLEVGDAITQITIVD
jgi:cyclophilin family peptidyl-prolyl cis-trans isomerase